MSKQDELKSLKSEMKELRETLKSLQSQAAPQEGMPEAVKYRYGITIVKLESGHPHIEFLIPEDAKDAVTLDDLAGLVRHVDERLRFLYQQHFAMQQAAPPPENPEEVTEDDEPEEDADAEEADGIGE